MDFWKLLQLLLSNPELIKLLMTFLDLLKSKPELAAQIQAIIDDGRIGDD